MIFSQSDIPDPHARSSWQPILPLSQIDESDDVAGPVPANVVLGPSSSSRVMAAVAAQVDAFLPEPDSVPNSQLVRRRLRGKQPSAAYPTVEDEARPSASRLRLRGKQRDPALPQDLPSPAPPAMSDNVHGEVWSRIDLSLFANEGNPRTRYFAVYNRIRHFLSMEAPNMPSNSVDPFEVLALEAHRTWKRMTAARKFQFISLFIQRTHPPNCIRDFLERQWPNPDVEKNAVVARTNTVLLTWQGAWGVLADVPASVFDDDLGRVQSYLRSSPEVEKIWSDFLELKCSVVQAWRVDSWTAAVEFCPATFKNDRCLRLHAHLFLRSSARFRVADQPFLSFHGGSPHVSMTIMGMAMRAGTASQGHYYLNSPKISSVCVASNKVPFVDYMVNTQWIWNSVQGGKMSYQSARQELIRCGKNIRHNLSDLDAWNAATVDMQLATRVAEVQNIVQSQQRVFRQLDSVRAWMSRYGSGCHARKPLMVLTGPSGTGKSSYVRSLVPRHALLELNCSGVRHVHLTGFDPLGTRLIFWDELPAATVISHKKLFQHPNQKGAWDGKTHY